MLLNGVVQWQDRHSLLRGTLADVELSSFSPSKASPRQQDWDHQQTLPICYDFTSGLPLFLRRVFQSATRTRD